MDSNELRGVGVALYGNDAGMQMKLSEDLGKTPGAMSRYLSGRMPIPEDVAKAARNLRTLKKLRDILGD